VFGSDDRVAAGIPAELAKKLEGKNAQEQQAIIIAHYQGRETEIMSTARNAIATARAGTPPPPATPITRAPLPTHADFMNDPVKAVRALQEGVMTKDEFNAQVGPMVKLAIQTAENLASAGKLHWNRFQADIRRIMSGCSQADQADVSCWEIAYNNVVGLNSATLTSEAVTAATRTATEIVQPPASPPPTVADLSKMKFRDNPNKSALTVCNGLNVSTDSYIKSMERIESGTFPGLTLDNRGRTTV
jgi:hypothetical protein